MSNFGASCRYFRMTRQQHAEWSNQLYMCLFFGLFVSTVIQERNGCYAFGHHICVPPPSTVGGERHCDLGRPAGRPSSVNRSSVHSPLTPEMCGSWNFESASVYGFWPKIRVRVLVHGNMQSWGHSQTASANDLTGNSLRVMQFIGGTPSTRYSLLDKITAGNGPVISCYNIQLNHSSFNVS